MIMKHFYMIYAEGHNAPAKKFDNKEDAEREARRIADKEHCEVFVLSDDYYDYYYRIRKGWHILFYSCAWNNLETEKK